MHRRFSADGLHARSRLLSLRFRALYNPGTKALSSCYRDACALFWAVRLLYYVLSALAMTTVFSPSTRQTSVLLVLSATLLLLHLYYRPYNTKIENILACIYCFLNVINMAIYVVYSIEDDILTNEGYKTLGTVQIWTNLAVMISLGIFEFAKRWKFFRKAAIVSFRKASTSMKKVANYRSSRVVNDVKAVEQTAA